MCTSSDGLTEQTTFFSFWSVIFISPGASSIVRRHRSATTSLQSFDHNWFLHHLHVNHTVCNRTTACWPQSLTHIQCALFLNVSKWSRNTSHDWPTWIDNICPITESPYGVCKNVYHAESMMNEMPNVGLIWWMPHLQYLSLLCLFYYPVCPVPILTASWPQQLSWCNKKDRSRLFSSEIFHFLSLWGYGRVLGPKEFLHLKIWA